MRVLIFIILLMASSISKAQQIPSLSITLENVDYPYPVKFLALNIENQDLRMAYMDIQPNNPNGKSILLFHGKNFGGYYWTNVIKALSTNGYRVIVPDQIGFGKSSKPFINYSFHRLAALNKQLLDSLGIQKAVLMGHSMGGMLASRFALLYPERTTQLILENPIGLEDYRRFVPNASPEALYQTELKTTPESVKRYYQTSYFVKWKPEYDELVRIASGVNGSAEFPRYAKVSALTAQMIYEQPVVYEFPLIKVPVLLLIGTQDKTIVGKARLKPEDQTKYGLYNKLGKETAAKIPGSVLVEFSNSGHIPHLEIPEEFLTALERNIK
jgi:pimeloyl-ACP methyl ester carboxylesterase